MSLIDLRRLLVGSLFVWVLLLGNPAPATVKAQSCQVLSSSVSTSGDCVTVTQLIGCCEPGIGPCGNLYFCFGTFCDNGSNITIEIFCA